MPPPKIAILGAGPAGLTLASLLTKQSIPYTIFDLRQLPSPDAVTQPSGSLDLHGESGLLALEACGLTSQFSLLANGSCSEEMILSDSHGVVQYRDEGDRNRPEIARNSLTQLLLDSVPPSTIRWETKVQSISPAPGQQGKWSLTFPPNSASDSDSNSAQQEEAEIYDLIIGADGAWSRVRPLLTDEKPYFSGINCITLTIPHLSTTHPHLATIIGNGSYSACGAFKGAMTQRGSLDSARVYLMMKSASETWLEESTLSTLTPSALKTKLLTDPELYADWGEEIKELIAVACDAESISLGQDGRVEMRPLYMLPPGHTWTHTPGLTLLGDAAHLMTPFAGEGVNMAMLDALELSQHLTAALALATTKPSTEDSESESEGERNGLGFALDDAVGKYEDAMFPRAKEIMDETWKNLNIIFSADAPRAFVRFFEEAMANMANMGHAAA